ncbi:MAG: class I SAM-dependent methyltransferase [Clostridia bacterium]
MTDAPARPLRPPLLDARLSTALTLAGRCETAADIGADHGRLSAVLLAQGLAAHVLVADVSEKALAKARGRICALHLEGGATFAVADGLDALEALAQKKADVIFILGMGGDTLRGILLRGHARLQNAALILGAQTELPLLRQTVCELGYRIRREALALEGGRCYELMRCEPALPGEMPYTEEELLLGPVLLYEHPPLYGGVLLRRENLLREAIRAMEAADLRKDRERLSCFRRELAYVERALQTCGEACK